MTATAQTSAISSRLGVIEGLDINAYHGGEGISNSGLNDMAQSPFHYYSRHLDPLRPPREEKPGQLEGHLAHCAILEPNEFSKRYVAGPDASRATKEWKAFAGSVLAGQTAVKPQQILVAKAQAVSVLGLSDVAALLREGASEVSAYWRDPVTGVLCRCRPDFVSPVGGGVILLDVKTFASAAQRDFMLQCARKHYERQAAFYSDGFERASGTPVLGFVFVAVEATWPFASAAWMLPDQWLEVGRRDNRRLIDLYATCKRESAWPSYSQGVELLSMPSWVQQADLYA